MSVQLTCPECLSAELCAVDGCRKHPQRGLVPAMPPREPIPLDYRPGKMVRAIMALTDRGEAAVKRGRTPFAPAPFAPDPEEPPMSTEPQRLPVPPPLPAPQPTASKELRIVPCQGGWIVYVGDHPAAVASDKPALGATVASLV